MVSESELTSGLASNASQQAAIDNAKNQAVDNNFVKWWKFFFKK